MSQKSLANVLSLNTPLFVHRKPSKHLVYSLAAVFIYSPLCFGLMRIFNWSSYTYVITSLTVCMLLFVLIAYGSLNYKGIRNRFYVTHALSIFIITLVFSSAVAHIGGTRTDLWPMWRQLIMALFPAILFFGCRSFAARFPLYVGINQGLIGIALLSFVSIGLEYTGLYKMEAYGERYFGFLSDDVSWLLAFVIIVFVAERKPYLAIVSIIFLAITQSLGPGIIMTSGIIVLYFFGRLFNCGSVVSASIQFSIGLFIAILFLSTRFMIYLERLLNLDIWNNVRVWATKLSIELFMDSPIFGLGFNSQQYFFPKYVIENLGLGAVSTPTSTAAKVLADGGIIGITAFLFFIVMVSFLCLKFLRRPVITREDLLLKGLSAWLLVFLWLNHSAAWLLPLSCHATLVFIVAGILSGVAERKVRMYDGPELPHKTHPLAAVNY